MLPSHKLSRRLLLLGAPLQPLRLPLLLPLRRRRRRQLSLTNRRFALVRRMGIWLGLLGWFAGMKWANQDLQTASPPCRSAPQSAGRAGVRPCWCLAVTCASAGECSIFGLHMPHSLNSLMRSAHRHSLTHNAWPIIYIACMPPQLAHQVRMQLNCCPTPPCLLQALRGGADGCSEPALPCLPRAAHTGS